MDDARLAQLAEDNLIRSVECFARAAGGEVFRGEALHVSTAPVALRSFNQIVVRSPVDEGAMAEAVGRFRGSDRFRLRALTSVGLDAEMLGKFGMVLRGGIPSLVLEPPGRKDIAGIEAREVVDEATLADHVALVAAAFDWESPELAAVFTAKLLTDEAWLAWVGYVDGVAVCTAQLVLTGDTAGVYYVGTAEGQRRKGYGAMITQCAVNAAVERGCRMISLQASPLGRPVYERMGFRVVAEYETYVAG